MRAIPRFSLRVRPFRGSQRPPKRTPRGYCLLETRFFPRHFRGTCVAVENGVSRQARNGGLEMRTQFRIAIAAAALLAGLSLAGASRANAGVSFRGTFPLPHGSISIGIVDPTFVVGAFVPYG